MGGCKAGPRSVCWSDHDERQCSVTTASVATAQESASIPNVSVTSWVSMYSRTSWINPSSNRKTQQ